MPSPAYDPLGRRWVLLAPDRARRPVPPPASDALHDPAPCDFCGGCEHRTPPETGRAGDAGGWRVRSFPNLYPAADAHEVVVHSPDHDALLEDLPGPHQAEVASLWAVRLRSFDVAARVAIVNRGRSAGASRAHDHSQLFGLGVVPPVLEAEAQTFGETGCVLCTWVAGDEYVAGEAAGATIMAHPVPVVPHELLVVAAHAPRFEDAGDDACEALGRGVGECVRRLRVIMDAAPAFNVVVHTAPREARRFHWHAHVYPRTGVWAGLEIGTGLPIVAADPRETAALVRDG